MLTMNSSASEEEMTSEDSIKTPNKPLSQLLSVRCCGVSITHLDLSHSSLDSIPSHVFTMKNLKTFDLSHNQIKFIDAGTARLTSLENISLDFNQLSVDKKTLESVGRMFPSVSKLSIAYQEDDGNNAFICSIEIPELLFPRLLYFNASGNEMRSIRSINGNHRIEKLVLHSNCLREIPSLNDCEKLTVLDVSNNCLLGAGKFAHLLMQSPLLRSVDFSGNSSCFRLNELPANSTQKPLDLVKVEPHSDLCRLAFSNTLYDHIDQTCVCISSISSCGQNQLFVCLMYGACFPASFKKEVPALLRQHLNQDPNDYLRNSLVSVCRSLHVMQEQNFNAILCHLTHADSGSTRVSINFACCGNDVSLKLLQEDDESFESASSLLADRVKVCDLIDGSSRRKAWNPITHLAPVTGRLELVQGSSLCLIGIKVKGEGRRQRNPCHQLFTNAPLNVKLRKYSEEVKFLPGEGHMVMCIQPNVEEREISEIFEYPEKYRSWDYILEENDKIERLEDKIVPVVKRNSIMASELTLSALKAQQQANSRAFSEKSQASAPCVQLFRI